MTDLSVIIVNWNTRELLRACLQSVAAGRGGLTLEVLVVDNASEDGSAAMAAAEFPEAILLRNRENVGFARANNQALRQAKGRYLLLLNSDTEVLGEVLAESVRYMDEHAAVGGFGCRVLNPDETMQATCFMEPSLVNLLLKMSGLFKLPWPRWCGREHYSHWDRDSEREVQVVTGCYLLVPRAVVQQVGLLDERFFFCGEETDWCRRIRAAGWKVCFAPVGEIMHHGNASGRRYSARRDLLLTQGVLRFHRKHSTRLVQALAWLCLWLFNLSRWIWWRLVLLLRPRHARARMRTRHFREVVQCFGRAGASRTGSDIIGGGR